MMTAAGNAERTTITRVIVPRNAPISRGQLLALGISGKPTPPSGRRNLLSVPRAAGSLNQSSKLPVPVPTCRTGGLLPLLLLWLPRVPPVDLGLDRGASRATRPLLLASLGREEGVFSPTSSVVLTSSRPRYLPQSSRMMPRVDPSSIVASPWVEEETTVGRIKTLSNGFQSRLRAHSGMEHLQGEVVPLQVADDPDLLKRSGSGTAL